MKLTRIVSIGGYDMGSTYTGLYKFSGDVKITSQNTGIFQSRFGSNHKCYDVEIAQVQSACFDMDLRSYTYPDDCQTGFYTDDNTGEIVVISFRKALQ